MTWANKDENKEHGALSREELKSKLYCTFTNGESSFKVYPSSYKEDESSKKICYLFEVAEDMNSVQFTNEHHDVVTNSWAYYDNAIYQVTMPEGNAPKYAYDQDGKRVEGPGYDQYTSTRVYFDNKNNWSNVYCYAFRSAAQVESAWPGYEITSQKEEFIRNGETVTLWYYDVDDRYTHIIFNNGGDSQTKDMDVYANGVYSQETLAYTAPDEVVNVHQIIGNHAVAPKAKTILYIPNENQGTSISLYCNGVYGGVYAEGIELPTVTLNGKTYYHWTSTQINGIELAHFTFKDNNNNEKQFEKVKFPEGSNYFIFDGRTGELDKGLTIGAAGLPTSITVQGENVFGVDNKVADKVGEKKD
ncbi:MAG: starch-binding protein, partial [Muribaculaceae bacterium]|nr:starch-binding protein [Muribaculaceae bacterium]